MDLCEITEEIQLSVVAPRIFVSHQALEYLRTMGKEKDTKRLSIQLHETGYVGW